LKAELFNNYSFTTVPFKPVKVLFFAKKKEPLVMNLEPLFAINPNQNSQQSLLKFVRGNEQPAYSLTICS